MERDKEGVVVTFEAWFGNDRNVKPSETHPV